MIDLPLPQHVQDHLAHLKRWANTLAGFYGSPVYLVGSALLGDNPNPRDWDIRMTMDDELFRQRFGDPNDWQIEGGSGEWTEVRWSWARACIKEVKAGWYRCRLNIDFQIYPASHVEHFYPDHLPRLRLDEMPEGFASKDILLRTLGFDEATLFALRRNGLETVAAFVNLVLESMSRYPHTCPFTFHWFGIERAARVLVALYKSGHLPSVLWERVNSPRIYDERQLLKRVNEIYRPRA